MKHILELAYTVIFLIVAWYGVHIYYAPNPIERATNTCDPIYWTAKYVHSDILNGFENDSAKSKGSRAELTGAKLGRGCFCWFAKLYHAVNPDLTCTQINQFNINDQPYRAYFQKEQQNEINEAKSNAPKNKKHASDPAGSLLDF